MNAIVYLLVRCIDLYEYFSWYSRHFRWDSLLSVYLFKMISNDRNFHVRKFHFCYFTNCICYSRVYFQTKHKAEWCCGYCDTAAMSKCTKTNSPHRAKIPPYGSMSRSTSHSLMHFSFVPCKFCQPAE